MKKSNDFAIWPAYEVFYIESMLFRTSAALDSVDTAYSLIESLKASEEVMLPHNLRRQLLDHLQNIVFQGAALSRFLWPSRDGENNQHKERGRLLRQVLEVTDKCPLKNREIRNQIEHFDELLDDYLHGGISGYIPPDYVGNSDLDSEVPIHIFRGYFLDRGKLLILRASFDINPLVEEIYRIDDLLMKMNTSGRLRAGLEDF